MSILFNSTGPLYSSTPFGYFYFTQTFVVMSIIFSLFLILLLVNIKTIFRELKKIQKKTWIFLIIIFILGFWLRNAEYRYGQGFDGYFYQDTAKVLYEKDLFMKGCAIGNTDSCLLYHQPLFPAGFPYLITLLFRIFGEHDILAMYLSGVLSSLTIPIIFLIGYLLFSDERKGLYAALIFSLIPLDIMVAPTASVRSTSLFFLALTVLFYLIALKKDSIKFWSLVAITFSLSIYMRQENSILLIPLIAGLFLFGYFRKEQFKNLITIKKTIISIFRKFSIPILILILTQIPVQHWILFSNIPDISQSRTMFSFQYLKVKATFILHDLFLPPQALKEFNLFSPIVSLIFLSSFIFLFKKQIYKEIAFISILFFIFFLFAASYLSYWPISFDYVRHIHPIVLSYALLSGFVIGKVEEKIKLNKTIFFSTIFIVLAIFSWVPFKFSIFKDGRMGDYPMEHLTVQLIKAVNTTPQNSLIFISQSAVPSFDLVKAEERRWVDINLIPADNYNFVNNEIANSKNRPMYLIEDYMCKYEKDESCNFIYENFKLLNYTVIDEVKVFRMEYLKI